jgi:uncharacterized membrane protein YfcA
MISLAKPVVPLHGSWIGFLSSIIGIGGGSFTTPLMIAGGYNIRKGIGTAAACGVPIAAAGAIGYMYYGQMADAISPQELLGMFFGQLLYPFHWLVFLQLSLGLISVTPSLKRH